jgi:hypothetical protein
MMKLIFENWRNYAALIIDEELLVESLQHIEQTVVKRAGKLMKGWGYVTRVNDDDIPYSNLDTKIINTNIGQISGWDLCGHIICALVGYYKIPNDIEEGQKKVALLWAYKQTIKTFEDKNALNYMFYVIADFVLDTNYGEDILPVQQPDLVQKYNVLNLGGYSTNILPNYMRQMFYISNNESAMASRDSKIIERFFQWNRFIRDGKKDLNAVSSFSELSALVEEAESKYKAWQEKQEQKDVEKGKEVLLDDQNWQIIAIHNKGAACQLGKGTDWCTAAPGLNYFKEYYQENDPLFYILDKIDGEKYQFHFGSKQYMDKNDNQLYPYRYPVGDEIIKVLAKVVPEKYSIARKEIEKNLLMKYRKTAHLNPQSGERW